MVRDEESKIVAIKCPFCKGITLAYGDSASKIATMECLLCDERDPVGNPVIELEFDQDKFEELLATTNEINVQC